MSLIPLCSQNKLHCQSSHSHQVASAGHVVCPGLSSTPFSGLRVAYKRQSIFRPIIGSSSHVSCRADMLEAAREQGVPVLVLKKSKARLFWEGAPTVYQGAIEHIISDSPPNTGDAALLVDANQKPLAWGVYNSESMFTLRILTWSSEEEAESTTFSLKEVLTQRIKEAVALRSAVGLPSPQTTIYRLINSEGDRLPGLIVDVYGDALVAASSAAWVEMNRTHVVEALRHHTKSQFVTWRPAKELLKLEGLNMQSSVATDEGEESGVDESSSSHTTASENGILYRIDQRHGQKTGFYADQRESRAVIRDLSAGQRVLDLCCYTGGFSLNAAAGGAEEVTGVDSSAAAISLAEENARHLQQPCRATFIRDQVENFMRSAAAEGRSWDVVILDPPKLAPNKGALPRARRKYESLNAAALKLVAPGGFLMTCSCSGAVAQGQGLLPMVKDAAMHAGRKVTLLRTAGAGIDHPLDPSYPEGRYLTNLLLRVR